MTITRRTVRYEAPDGHGEPTLWHHEQGSEPMPILSRHDLEPAYRDAVWPLIVEAVAK